MKKEKKNGKKNPYFYNMVCGLDKYTNPAPKSKYIIYTDDAKKITGEPHSPCTLKTVLTQQKEKT